MSDRFLELDRTTRKEILESLKDKLPLAPAVIEKDVWVCWALHALFTMPGRIRMAFKGGTSLSKVYGAIHRFSEDVDVTLDYRALARGVDPFAKPVSKTKMKKLAEDLKVRVKRHTFDVVVPHLKKLVSQEVHNEEMGVECDEAGEKIRIKYDSVVDERSAYVSESVLIELGGRNITEPSERHELEPFAAPHVKNLEWPFASVDVLSPKRTFWEKATLIHAECNRGELKAAPVRMSRHWYDLAMLADHEIGTNAVADRQLLASVVEHKKVFFYTAHANYDDCLLGKLRLVPHDPMKDELRKDFMAMRSAGMFDQEPPSFDAILARLDDLARHINSTT